MLLDVAGDHDDEPAQTNRDDARIEGPHVIATLGGDLGGLVGACGDRGIRKVQDGRIRMLGVDAVEHLVEITRGAGARLGHDAHLATTAVDLQRGDLPVVHRLLADRHMHRGDGDAVALDGIRLQIGSGIGDDDVLAHKTTTNHLTRQTNSPPTRNSGNPSRLYAFHPDCTRNDKICSLSTIPLTAVVHNRQQVVVHDVQIRLGVLVERVLHIGAFAQNRPKGAHHHVPKHCMQIRHAVSTSHASYSSSIRYAVRSELERSEKRVMWVRSVISSMYMATFPLAFDLEITPLRRSRGA